LRLRRRINAMPFMRPATPPPKNRDWATYNRAKLNEQLPCSVPACPKRRSFTSQYCANHAKKRTRYGDPRGSYIPQTDLRSYQRLARKLVRRFAGHPATLAALNVMSALLAPGDPVKFRKTSARYYLHRELMRLASSNPPVQAREALEAVLMVYLFAYFQPRQLPNDGDALSHQMAYAVFRLRRFTVIESHYDHTSGTVENIARKLSGQALGSYGRLLRVKLAPFIANVLKLVEEEERKKQEQIRAMYTPLADAETKA
jgi:hypothetical protein